MREIRLGTRRASAPLTVAEAAENWLTGARAGSIRNRSGDEYKPSSIRGYEEALRIRVLPELGSRRLDTITRSDLQALVDRLLAEGQHPSTIRNSLMPLRAIFRRAIARGDLAINPTRGLELPAVRGTRDRIAAPEEAAALLAALEQDRAVWATAMYAGLRRGELTRARAERHRPRRERDPSPALLGRGRGRSSSRSRTPADAPSRSRACCDRHSSSTLARSAAPTGSRSARALGVPFQPKSLSNRAGRAWKRAGLQPITLHECRHTFASLMIAAGVNAKALSTYMGHASVMITLDRYGHLMPGNEREAAGLLDAFLSRSRGE